MNQTKLVKIGLVNSIIAAVYVSLVALIMSTAEKFFGDVGVLGGVAFLLLFVISAAVMGYLILGKPIMLYLDGLKKEAVKLFYFTIAWLALWVVIVFIVLAIFR